ncbi:HCL404Cp [Eremothecium sinecaudum]|uniref:Aminopeptidase n=1 Tax=Eremothecium sinecaudum TaxID=45286 RepID=A0A109UZ08_9SACH|nr:HCL404Cp [Eremothecium sinecaudum]AMD19747.1 HCL404Cp [Eremothecium sinecaudum]
MGSDDKQLLPSDFKPIHYSIAISNLKQDKFDGVVDITLKSLHPSNTVTLHASGIDVHHAVAKLEDGGDVALASKSYDSKKQVLSLQFETQLSHCVLHIEYTATVQTNMSGFYSSFYDDVKTGERKIMYSTQFEATAARSAFPCFDEPSLKATFDVTVSAPKQFTVLSNMPEKEVKSLDNGAVSHTFHRTPRMSTYLVAWAVGEFDFIDTETEKAIYPTLEGYNTDDGSSSKYGKLPIRLYTVKGKSQLGKFAIGVAAKVVDHFSELFEIAYPLPKLDLVCVEEYSHNAMENFSLITFRPSALLVDGDASSGDPGSLQKVAYVVSHEIAHQWFGNLVTMKWWDDLWLNEGFATWVGYLAVTHFFPEWDVSSMVMINSHEVALEMDALRESHPVKVAVRDANDIDQVFDTISYLKGCSVLEQFSGFLGNELFLKGVALYMKKFKFSNASFDDLFLALGEVANSDLLTRAKAWILNIGYPVVSVTAHDGKIVVDQQRYLSYKKPSDAKDSSSWWIPLKYIDKNSTHMLEFDSKTLTTNLSSDGFVLFNVDCYGFYRIHYAESNILENICQNLEKLSSRSKIGLISDVYATGTFEQLATVSLQLVEKLGADEFYVWSLVISEMLTVRSLIFSSVSDQVNSMLSALITKLIEKQLNPAMTALANELALSQGDPKSFLKAQTYEAILTTAGTLGHPAVVNRAREFYKSGKISPRTRELILSTILSRPDTPVSVYEDILKELKTATLTHREVILKSLGKVTNPELIDRTLKLIFLETDPMNVQYGAETLGKNPYVRQKLWDFFRANYDAIYKRLSINAVVIDRSIRFSFSELVGDDVATEFDDFFKTKEQPGFDRGVRQTLERIHRNTEYVKSNLLSIGEVLTKQ